jgi:hypothetical protein
MILIIRLLAFVFLRVLSSFLKALFIYAIIDLNCQCNEFLQVVWLVRPYYLILDCVLEADVKLVL